MLDPNMSGRDVFVRHTGPRGDTYMQLHRVWGGNAGVERFMAGQREAAIKVNDDHQREHPKDVARAWAEQITEDQYRAERNA